MENSIKKSTHDGRKTQLFHVIDGAINSGVLTQLTIHAMAQQSGVSEAEILRYFNSNYSIYEGWAQKRLEHLQNFLLEIPTERVSLLDWLNQLSQDGGLCALLCLPNCGHVAVDKQLIEARDAVRTILLKYFKRLYPANKKSPQVLLNSLIDVLRNHRSGNIQLKFVAWESQFSEEEILPSSAKLQRLVLFESGFVFDPSSGQSFSVNEVGLNILRLAKQNSDINSLIKSLADQFDADCTEIKRDVYDFADRLRSLLLCA